MAKYNVEIIENLSKVVEIEADNYDEAEDIAYKKYDNCQIELDYEDKNETVYKPYPSQNISNDFTLIVKFDQKRKQLSIVSRDKDLTDLTRQTHKCETEDDLKFFLNSYLDNNIEYEKIMSVEEIQKQLNTKRDKDMER